MKALFACLCAAAVLVAAGSASAAFPGQNGKIAFASNRAGAYDIFAANADGNGLADLTATPGIDELEPAWSPDGRRVAYRRDGAIWVMNADGGAQTQVTGGSAAGELALEPAWSPDGLQIAFARLDTEVGIWVVGSGGGPEQQLTNATDRSPAWSPDGSTLAVERHARGSADRIVLVSATGAGAEVQLPGQVSSSNDSPAWSPDGTKVAFDVNGGEGLRVVEVATGNAQPFGFGSDPEWAPDGSALVFSVLVDASTEIVWSAWPAGGEQSVTGNDTATDISPSWQPAVQNTSAGSNVRVALGPVTITFANVVAGGETTAVAASSGPPVPSFFQVASDFYELSTTATWDTGAGAQVCFAFTGAPAPQIIHFVGGAATIVSTTAGAGEVCGVVDSFSPFVLVRPAGDTVAPTLSLPPDRTVNATSPAGALVTYVVSATDAVDPSPAVSCAPRSGATFAIGSTTVECTATDASGNAGTGRFTVKVKGAKEQIADLIQKVVSASQLPPALKTLAISKLNALLASFDPSNAAQRQAVCAALQVFKAVVQAQAGRAAAEWIADAGRIRAVLGCSKESR